MTSIITRCPASPIFRLTIKPSIKSIHSSGGQQLQSFRKWYQQLWKPATTEPPYDHVAQIGDPVLRQKANDVPADAISSPEVNFLIDRMTGVLRKYKCVGLSAPQIGIPLNIILMEFTEKHLGSHTKEAAKTKQMETLPLTVCVHIYLLNIYLSIFVPIIRF